MFTRTDDLGWAQSTAFKKAFSMDVDIEFIGVWYVLTERKFSIKRLIGRPRDTVNSVGLIPRRLPFTSSNSSIRTFRHAVSLDEHRAKFKANLYNRPTAAQASLGTKPGEMPKSGTPGDDTIPADDPSMVLPKLQRKKPSSSSWRINEARFDGGDPGMVQDTDVLEVWFAGCHCGALTFSSNIGNRFSKCLIKLNRCWWWVCG